MRSRILIGLLTSSILWAGQAPVLHAQEASPDAASPDGTVADSNEIIVTAQKRAESLQDVPIAVSAFSQENLLARGLTGGGDLQQAIPNVSFGSTGFGRHNFQIRGIGSQLQGQGIDEGVGIHVNNIPLTANRIAAAEYYDIERIEVLRGPQGTLYGRNATGGVVNTITAAPKDDFSAEITGEYGRYDTRRVRGYINIPLTETLALRAAGTLIKRDGNITNVGTGNKVNSRDVWSTRLTAQWEPSDAIRARLMWEHFEQNDSSGGNAKIICAPNAGPASVGGVPTNPLTATLLSNGCLRNQTQDPANNGVVSSLSTLPGLFGLAFGTVPFDAFAGKIVSRNLNSVETSIDPRNRARNDLVSLDLQIGLGGGLTLNSVTSYSRDKFALTLPVFGGVANPGLAITPITPTGTFNDPQVGLTDRLNGFYMQDRNARQWTQELRIQSDFGGPLNFNLGGIYLDYRQDNNLIALSNTTTMASIILNATNPPGAPDIYIDPLADPDGTGHSYYNNRSPYKLRAGALFGEAYYELTDNLKATAGLRYTNDHKEQINYPVQLLVPGAGFPVTPAQTVTFEEVTGRFTVDWKPPVSFTDDTLVYASFSRGYKGGGFNPGATGGGVKPTFDPEFVNAFELGTKNRLAGGAVMLNLTGFYYDYKGYQVAKLSALSVNNENVDATIKGVEFEAAVEPLHGLRFDTQIGYLDSKIKAGSSIDYLDRTQGDPSLTVVRSIDAGSFAVQCTVPTAEVAGLQAAINAGLAPPIAMATLCTGPTASPNASPGNPVNLAGKQLPAAPHWTLAFGGEYEMALGADWSATVRADYYRQSRSFARIYNSVADRIGSWQNLNLSLRFVSQDKGLEFLLYARNLMDAQAITAIQVQSEELGGTRVVQGKDRATYGFAVTKRF